MTKVILQNTLICSAHCADVKKRKRRNSNSLMLGTSARLLILQVGTMFKGLCMIRVKFGPIFRTCFRYIKLFCYFEEDFSSIYGILFHSLARYSVRSDAILKIKSKIVKYLHFSYLFEWEIYSAVLKRQNLFVRYWSFLDKSLLKIFCLFQHAHNVFRKKLPQNKPF